MSDPNNLPHTAQIKIGGETLDLRMSAIRDRDGAYLGPMLTWNVVTKRVQLADNFEGSVMAVVDSVSSAATEMQASAESMSANAAQTTDRATAVAAATTVPSSSKHLPATLEENSFRINRRTAKSIAHRFTRLVEQAVTALPKSCLEVVGRTAPTHPLQLPA